MKKNYLHYLIAFAIGFCICYFSKCGSSDNTKDNYAEVKNGNESPDFEKELKKLDKLYKEYEDSWSTKYGQEREPTIVGAATKYACEAKEIFGKEVRYLISQQNEEAYQRLVYLFNEMKVLGDKIPEGSNYYSESTKIECYQQYVKYNNELCDIVMDLGIRDKNKELCQIALSHYTSNVDYEEKGLKKFIKYKDKDKKEAESKYIKYLINEAQKSGDNSTLDSYISNADLSLDDSYLLSYMSSTKTEVNSEKILNLLISLENEIPNKPTMGKVTTDDYDYKTNTCDPYSDAVKHYNDACRMILNIAIKNKNKYLAERVLTKFKPNINSIKTGSFYKNDWLYNYNVTIDNEDIKSAKSSYQEAVRSGAFK